MERFVLLEELDSFDAVGLAELVARRQISARELVMRSLERIEALNPALNAVVDIWAARALNLAMQDARPGPLAGVPMLFKDTVDVAGTRLTRGSRTHLFNVSRTTAPYAQMLEAAGLIAVGKTNTPEFGLLDVTEPLLFGPTRNPWNLHFSPGGSSGGAAAAVAAGMVPMAHGTDGGGSIRGPAAACGLFGFKPSAGSTSVERQSLFPNVRDLVAHHVLTRSVRDSAVVYAFARQTITGQAVAPVQAPVATRLRVAMIATPSGGGSLEADSAAALVSAAALLTELGHVVEPQVWPFDASAFHAGFFDLWSIGTLAEAQAIPAGAERNAFEAALEPWTQGLIARARSFDDAHRRQTFDSLGLAVADLNAFLGRFDVLMTPVATGGARPLGAHAPDQAFDVLLERVRHQVGFTPIHNIAGTPAMSVPLHFTEAGMPAGVQFAAAHGRDELLLSLALQLEAASPWMSRYPDLFISR